MTRADEYDLDLSGAIISDPITISLTANNPNEYDTFLQVIDANTGNVVADSDDDGGNFNSLIRANQQPDGSGNDDPSIPNEFRPLGGRDYKIRVTSYSGLNQPGNYPYFLQVSQLFTDQADINLIPRNSDFDGEVQTGSFVSINGELNENDFTFPAPTGGNTLVDEYKLEVQQPGEDVNVTASTSDSGLDPYLEVINAQTGNVIDFDNNNGGGVNSQLNFTSQPGIDYRVRVTNFSGTNTTNIGTYRLDVSVSQGNLTLTAREGPSDPTPGNGEDVVRFWDEQALAHIFTADTTEADELTNNPRYRRERIEFRAPLESTPGVLPIYRYENQTTETKFYSPQPPEIISRDFPILQFETIAFYGFSPNEPQPEGTVVVHRFFNEGASLPGSPVHFYTATEENRQVVIRDFPTFREEVGAGWFAFPGEGGFN
ncbi:MAG: hypothetical protein AAGJ08_23275 [Cyanobacteria bacterium P01_H01_bin.35]